MDEGHGQKSFSSEWSMGPGVLSLPKAGLSLGQLQDPQIQLTVLKGERECLVPVLVAT